MATKKTSYEAPTPASDKKKALQTALSQIEKSFGKGAVMRLGDRPEMNVDAIPTGSLALDAALGIGGVPKGRIIEIYGPESSGKTTLALHILAQAQKQGGEVAFVDAEHALDPVYAKNIGVDIVLPRAHIDVIRRDLRELLQNSLKADGHKLGPDRCGDKHLGDLRKLPDELLRPLDHRLGTEKFRIFEEFKDHVRPGTQFAPPVLFVNGHGGIKIVFFICQADGVGSAFHQKIINVQRSG